MVELRMSRCTIEECENEADRRMGGLCQRHYHRRWREANKERVKAIQARWRDQHRDRMNAAAAARMRQLRAIDPEPFREANRRSRDRYIDFYKHRQRQRTTTPEYRQKRNERYATSMLLPEHREKHRAIMREYAALRRRVDPVFALKEQLRSRLNSALRRRGLSAVFGSGVAGLGCSIIEFKSYIEALFLPGMTWDNRGRKGWHLDHMPLHKLPTPLGQR